MSAPAQTCFAGWRFGHPWRRYQELCLEAFEADRAAGRHQTLLVAPPGSGKTVVGLEIIRRLGRPALVLSPTQTIQRQWHAKQELFGPPDPALKLLTYQALCQATDPEGMLADAAERVWARERAEATGESPEEVAAAARTWTGAAAQRRDAEISRIVARLKRRAAGGELLELSAEDLLSPTARDRLDDLVAEGVQVVVLDECHHLASLWGALLVAVLRALRPVHVVGLTATSPRDLTAEQANLYPQLLDEEDFVIPTPAVVREGHLAPYQELVQLSEPLASERTWLDERHARFSALLIELDEVPARAEHLALSAWLLSRIRDRESASGAQMSWAEFARRHPKVAAAGLRWLYHVGEPPPPGAPRGEGHRAPLDMDDWVTLLDDYVLRCLRPDGSDEADQRLERLAVALRDLGFAVTRTGIRRAGGDVDRVLLNSASKPLMLCDILACERSARAGGMRAIVLCDTEHPPRQPEDSPLQLSGGGRGLLAALGADQRMVALRPALITSETFAVLPEDLEWWTRELAGLAADEGLSDLAASLQATPNSELVTLSHPDGRFSSRRWTAWATALLAAGRCQVLIGTRGLLGEGWDCPPVNVLVDMTAVAADISVRQMRGRSLRLDPGDPDKLASNWDVVCVAPDLSRGHADYERFVRRHAHLHAPCEDGVIETGPSHVHPELSPYGPPDASRFGAINIEQRERAEDRPAARERWRIGEPYVGVDLDVVSVRRPSSPKTTRPEATRAPVPPDRGRGLAAATAGALVATGGLLGAGVAEPVMAALAAVPAAATAGLGVLAGRRRRELHPPEIPLEWAAGAVCDPYVRLGELDAAAAGSLRFTPRPEGWVRVSLPEADPEESARVASALDDLLGGGGLPRYVVSRRVWTGHLARLGTVWHPVPSDLGRRRDRADAFHAAWQRWCGRGELRYCRGDAEAEALALEATGTSFETQRRQIWL